MEDKVYESELVWNADTILSTLLAAFNILLMLLIFYCVFRLYIAVIRYLDKHS